MIYGITGKAGSGKTYFMVRLCKKYLQEGRNVFCNVKINEENLNLKAKKGKEIGKLYYWDNLNQFRKVHSGIILMDEAGAYFNSRKWSSLSEEDLVKFQQHRKDGLEIIYSAQNFDFVDKVIRQLTNLIYVCRKMGNLFWTSLYDPDYVNNKQKKTCYGRQFYFLDEEITKSYDTWQYINRDFEKEYITNNFKLMNTFFNKKN